MKILHGTVVNGQIVVEGDPLAEGARVTIVDESDEEPYRLCPAEESAIEDGDAEIERGDYITAAQLLAEIQRARG